MVSLIRLTGMFSFVVVEKSRVVFSSKDLHRSVPQSSRRRSPWSVTPGRSGTVAAKIVTMIPLFSKHP